MNKVIELCNVAKGYGKNKATQVLFDINLEIFAGELVAIIGKSGSGKSTLLNIMGTLDKPTRGEVFLVDKEISKMDETDLANFRNQEIGFIFQFHYLLPEFSVLDNVLMPEFILQHKFSYAKKARALELLQLVGLEDVSKKKVSSLSGGEQQRVAIARSLMNNPKILFADEPTGNLDSKTTEQVYKLFQKINRELKTTIVIITHDNKVAEKCTRIIELQDGQVVMDVRS